jgi:transposase
VPLACGVRTHGIPTCEVHHRDSRELEHFPSILSKVAKNSIVRAAYGDKLYCTVDSYEFVAALGATAYFPFREGFTGAAGGEFGRMFHIFMADPEAFWKHYHQRSNIEAAISMMKTRIFGSRILWSKSPTGMKNEIYCRVIAHNMRCLIMCMFEHGIVPKLLAPPNGTPET